MSKFCIYTDKPEISFDTHLAGLEEQTRQLFLSLRTFIKSLGDNVIEEARPHRVAYAKTFNFRTFVDIQPRNNSLVISIKKGRNESTITEVINSTSELNVIQNQIIEAYRTIK
jgi:predicted transport protein